MKTLFRRRVTNILAMADMKAVRLHDPLDLRSETVATAQIPQRGDVRVRLASAGICGSDIHNYELTYGYPASPPSQVMNFLIGWNPSAPTLQV